MIERLLTGLMLCSFMMMVTTLLILLMPMVFNMGVEEWIRLKKNINKLKEERKKREK